MDQAGQQEVAMNGSFSGTSFRKSFASSIVQRSAPDRYLADIRKTKCLECAADLCIFQSLKLACDGRCYDGIDGSLALQCEYGLVDLSLVNDCTERAADETHAAGHTFILIDLGAAMFVRMDCAHAAGRVSTAAPV